MGDVRAEGRDFVVETKHAGFKPSTGQPKQARDGMANEILDFGFLFSIAFVG